MVLFMTVVFPFSELRKRNGPHIHLDYVKSVPKQSIYISSVCLSGATVIYIHKCVVVKRTLNSKSLLFRSLSSPYFSVICSYSGLFRYFSNHSIGS